MFLESCHRSAIPALCDPRIAKAGCRAHSRGHHPPPLHQNLSHHRRTPEQAMLCHWCHLHRHPRFRCSAQSQGAALLAATPREAVRMLYSGRHAVGLVAKAATHLPMRATAACRHCQAGLSGRFLMARRGLWWTDAPGAFPKPKRGVHQTLSRGPLHEARNHFLRLRAGPGLDSD